MDGIHGDRERSFALAERANALMRDYGPSATPHSYAVWYAYVAGTYPHMNDALKRLTGASGCLTGQDIESLYASYLDPARLSAATERASSSVLSEIAGVMEVLDLSLGSSAQYAASLRTLTQDLDGMPSNQTSSVREVVAALVATTREVTANNRTLEARMRESRREIEALRETLEATRLESLTDPLTGLSNRKHFEDSLGQLVRGASAATPACLIVIDVDSFKRFNDVYGHITGDQVLRLVALVMREHVKAGAILARFGGEEFAMLLPDTGRAAAYAIAETVRTSVMARELVKRSTGESLGKITISLGLAMHQPGDTAVSFLERADQCMFRAKRDGRNRTVDDADGIPADAVLDRNLPNVA
ncbi:GGDEF domain-containing protein [Methylobacterium sp. 37f]|uniref:GGDEF domain-containing protein n=1 Tax=Methylobacterium sp. 37f TaxID=2817058 RepID=UPI001FFCF801|nr:GGDEF domain-containing protein [Methylobacterium sp. 37f]MCK2056076.1 GGDEF domain-containing protein [Methylobacterium sp. 37f]